VRADERTAAIPVLALTAQAMAGDRERFLTAGFDGYLPKPVDIAALVDAVGEHCR
jgi:CheY-like chemotaxis protein